MLRAAAAPLRRAVHASALLQRAAAPLGAAVPPKPAVACLSTGGGSSSSADLFAAAQRAVAAVDEHSARWLTLEEARDYAPEDIAAPVSLHHKHVRAALFDGRVEEALDCYADMLDDGLIPRGALYTLLLRVLCQDGSLELASQLLADMRRHGLRLSVEHYDALLDGFLRQCPDRARPLYTRMRREGLTPGPITYNKFMAAALKCDEPWQVLLLVDDMEQAGVQGDALTTGYYISALADAMRSDDLLAVVTDEMARVVMDELPISELSGSRGVPQAVAAALGRMGDSAAIDSALSSMDSAMSASPAGKEIVDRSLLAAARCLLTSEYVSPEFAAAEVLTLHDARVRRGFNALQGRHAPAMRHMLVTAAQAAQDWPALSAGWEDMVVKGEAPQATLATRSLQSLLDAGEVERALRAAAQLDLHLSDDVRPTLPEPLKRLLRQRRLALEEERAKEHEEEEHVE
eukprot:PLAT12704.1.p1 GENE.PLAT12704.1~~PLAT12704.1.p1  ORF type:complete len:461 (+),score=178.66 PLAT12704.1:1712-3094(+)